MVPTRAKPSTEAGEEPRGEEKTTSHQLNAEAWLVGAGGGAVAGIVSLAFDWGLLGMTDHDTSAIRTMVGCAFFGGMLGVPISLVVRGASLLTARQLSRGVRRMSVFALAVGLLVLLGLGLDRHRRYEGLVKRAEDALQHGDHSTAVALYSEALPLARKPAEIHFRRGKAYLGKRDLDAALSDLTTAIRLDPNNVFAFFYRGNVHFEKRQYDLAIVDFSESIRLDPELAEAYFNRSLAYQAKWEWSRAKADREQAKRLNPKIGQ